MPYKVPYAPPPRKGPPRAKPKPKPLPYFVYSAWTFWTWCRLKAHSPPSEGETLRIKGDPASIPGPRYVGLCRRGGILGLVLLLLFRPAVRTTRSIVSVGVPDEPVVAESVTTRVIHHDPPTGDGDP